MGFELVGQVWDVTGFRQWIKTQDLSWAKGCTMHHTGTPSLAQRPHGIRLSHMRNLAHYYWHQLGWSSGPHLFIDDDQIFGLSSIERRGVHAKSFNATHIGIEVLGNYDTEDPKSGRGLECWMTAAAAVAAIQKRGLLDVNFHRDDPRTSKTCPGKKVEESWFGGLVAHHVTEDSDREDPPGGRVDLSPMLDAIEWQVRKIREASK